MWLAIIIIVVILIIFYNIFNWNTQSYEDYLYGCWVAEDDAFCEEADIDSMMIFIGEPERKWTGSVVRNCYIIIMTDMANDGFTLSYTPQWGGVGVGKYSVKAKVQFDEDQLWDENVTISMNVLKGTMKIISDDGSTVYARLNKQHDITNTARVLEED